MPQRSTRQLGGNLITRTTRPIGRATRFFTLSRLMLCALACLTPAALSSSAAASSPAYCVVASSAADCPSGAVEMPSIKAAVDDASPASSSTVYLTSGLHTALAPVALGNKPVRLVGVGATRPVVTAPATSGGAVISTISPMARFTNIAILIPASTGMTGLSTENGGQSIERVSVSGPAAAASTGIFVRHQGPAIEDVSVSLDGAGGNSVGIKVDSSTTPSIRGVNVSGVRRGIEMTATKNFAVGRARIEADTGIKLTGSDGSLSSSLISAVAVGIDVDAGNGASEKVNVFNCTLLHPGATGGTGVRTFTPDGGLPLTVTADSSIIHGYERAAYADGVSRLDLRYSSFDGAAASTTDDGLTLGPGNRPDTQNYGFVDAAGGDFRLRLDSPLVDAGNPVSADFTQADSGSDLDGNPRSVSRGAGKIRDVGAYEVQNRAPTPRVEIVTAVPSTTSPTLFSAANSSDADGDALTQEWSFDGLPGPSGETVRKQFLSPGPHIVRLTTTDKAGASSTTSRQFDVEMGYLNVKLKSQAARITTKGTFKVSLSCPVAAVSDCTGRLVLRTAQKVDAKRYTKRPGWSASAKQIEAVNYVFRIAPGLTRSVTVRTFKTFQNILAVEKKFKLTGGIADASTTNARITSNRATFTISAPKLKR